MGYLKRFARNKRGKEKSIVLQARLPESLYDDFKGYCDDLGLSISEGVFLLVEREMKESENNKRVINDELATTLETTKKVNNNDKTNTKKIRSNTSEGKSNTNKNTKRKQINTTKWQVEGDLACPVCEKWIENSNFSKHAKNVHGSSRNEIFANEEYIDKANTMVFGRTGRLIE